MRGIPEWAITDHPFVGRHVTCGEIHYEVVAVESLDDHEVLVSHPQDDEVCMWISLRKPTNWFFVSVLDEIVKAL